MSSSDPRRDHLRPQGGRPVERAPQGLRFPDWGHHLLEAPSRLAKRRSLARLIPCRSPSASCVEGKRLEPRLRQRTGGQRGDFTGPDPTDRGKPGTKRHVVVDRQGLPLTLLLSGANTHDSMMLAALLDAVAALRTGKPGRPRRRPDKLHADKEYDYERAALAESNLELPVGASIPRNGLDGIGGWRNEPCHGSTASVDFGCVENDWERSSWR